MTDFEQAVSKLQQVPFMARLVNALTPIGPGERIETFGVKYLPKADCVYLYGLQGPYKVRLTLNPDQSTHLDVLYDTSEEYMANLEHPSDVRRESDPPCVVCGQSEKGHPTIEGFHKYQAPSAATPASPGTPADAEKADTDPTSGSPAA